MQFESFVSLIEKFPFWTAALDGYELFGRFELWNDGMLYSVSMRCCSFNITFDEQIGLPAPFNVEDGRLRYTGISGYLTPISPITLYKRVHLAS